jgi:hypothetical protein
MEGLSATASVNLVLADCLVPATRPEQFHQFCALVPLHDYDSSTLECGRIPVVLGCGAAYGGQHGVLCRASVARLFLACCLATRTTPCASITACI